MTNFSLISLLLYVTAASEFVRGGVGGVVSAARLLTSFSAVLHCQQYLYLPNAACFHEAVHRSCNKGRVTHSERNLCVLLIFLLN